MLTVESLFDIRPDIWIICRVPDRKMLLVQIYVPKYVTRVGKKKNRQNTQKKTTYKNEIDFLGVKTRPIGRETIRNTDLLGCCELVPGTSSSSDESSAMALNNELNSPSKYLFTLQSTELQIYYFHSFVISSNADKL